MKNRRITLRHYPAGIPQAGDFELAEADVAELNAGEVLVETHYLSMDPAPRLRMNGSAKFPPPLPLGQVVMGRGVGIVRVSRFEGLTVGDAVVGELGWQDYACVSGAQLRKVNSAGAPLQAALGVLGPSGITAYFLTHDAAKVRSGDTAVISAAAGSVGSVAVQLARTAGARVVGVVGGAHQARFVQDLGADAVVDYRSATLDADIARACPAGADVFLDSVGGGLHNAVLAHIADHARIVAFGYISAYNSDAASQSEYGSIYQIIRRRATVCGFLIGDYAPRFGEALEHLSAALSAGTLQNFEHCVQGLDNAPAAFAALFGGEPVGKQLVQVWPHQILEKRVIL